MDLAELYDVTIIGGGPAGLFAAYYAGLRGMRTKIIDALPDLGGQLIALYPEKYIYDVPGFPKILAKDLAVQLIEQGLQYGASVFLDEKIIRMEQIPQRANRPIFKLVAESGQAHYTKSILLTVGIGAFTPRKLDLPDARKFEGRGVFYFVREKSKLEGKDVLIVGGGDSAIDWALNLSDVAKSITLIHRREEFRAHEDSVQRLQETSTVVKVPYEIKSIQGNTSVESVTIFNNKTKEVETLPVGIVLLNLGFHASIGPLTEWGLRIEKNDVVVNSQMETNISGIYAAGDISTFPGKLKLIATGFGEAAIAVNAIKAYIDPKAKFFPGHSSDMQPPPKLRA